MNFFIFIAIIAIIAMQGLDYNQFVTNYQQQIQDLEDLGLQIKNKPKAEHILQNISFEHLKPYWIPFLKDQHDIQFKEVADFDAIFKHYCFDDALRRLISSELAKIEISVRSKLIYELTQGYGPLWDTNADLFKDSARHKSIKEKIEKEYQRTEDQEVIDFKNQYPKYCPPTCMKLRVASFGTISVLFKNLKVCKEKRAIANYYGLSEFIFEKWLHCFVYLRNICAHHGRVWNRAFRIIPKFPKNPKKSWGIKSDVNNNRLYFMICIIHYFLQTIHPNSSFLLKVLNLIEKFPMIDMKSMGFPENWQEDEIWFFLLPKIKSNNN